jgi:hypothetical protein
MNKAVEAFFNADNIPSETDTRLDSGPDNSIQCGAIATAGEYANAHRSDIFLE